MTRTTILVTALLLAAASLGAQEASSDVVALQFDWPPGLAARVTHSRQQVINADVASEGEAHDTSGAVLVYSMRVAEHPGGRLISHDDLAVELPPGINRFAEWVLLQQTMEEMVGLVVTDNGRGMTVDAVGLDRLVAELRSLLDPVFASLPQPRLEPWDWDDWKWPRLQQAAVASAKETWFNLVAGFADGKLELGTVLRVEDEEELSMFPGTKARIINEFTFSSYTPCAESATEPSCVVLELTSTPDQEAYASIVDSLAHVSLQGTGLPYGARLVSSRLEKHVRLVTEPRGLIPHHLEVRKYQRQEMEMGGEKGWTEMIFTDTYDFDYVSR